jgi:hypothetical protein
MAVLLAIAGLVSVADAQVRSEVDARRIGVTDLVQLTVTVEAQKLPDQVAMPALVNLILAGGPSVSTQMSYVNGRMSQSRSWTWALRPMVVGRAEIGAVRVQLDLGEAAAPAIPIEVVPGSVKPQPPRRSGSIFDEDPFASPGRGRRAEPKLFIEAKPSRGSLFVGEPLLLTYYLYTQTGVSGLQFAEPPQFTGFWAEDLPSPERPPGEPATVDGVSYRRFPIFMKLLFPTRAGRLTIPPSTLSLGIPGQGFFDAGGVVQRSTQPITVEVKPIPDDEPGFSGAVGRFKATAGVDRSTVALGDAATLRFRIEGSGNLKWIDRAPQVDVPGAKVYPPQVKSNLQTGPSGIAGSRTWEFVIVPQTAGTLEIPALAFSYFDPSQRRIVKSETAALPLRVEGGVPGAAVALPPTPGLASRGGPLPLRVDLEPGSGGASLPGGTVGVIAGVILLLHGALLGGGSLARLMRPRRAGRIAASRNVRGALRDLERIGRGGMTKEAAAAQIEKTIHGVFGSVDGGDSERTRAVRNLLDEVHAVRYAPQLGDYSERVRELVAHAGEVLREWA